MTCARQMTLSKGGLIAKGIYYIDGLCAIQMLLGRDSDPSLGGSYMLADTVPLLNCNPSLHLASMGKL